MMKLKTLIKVVLILLIVFISLVIIKYIKVFDIVMLVLNIFVPVFVGFIYSWLLNPLHGKFKCRFLTCIIVFLLIVLSLFLFLYYLIPLIYKEVNELVKFLPGLYDFSRLRLMQFGININDLNIDINKIIEIVPNIVISFFKSCFKYIGTIFVGLIIGLYMSMEYAKIIEFFMGVIPKKYKCEVVGIMSKIGVEVRKCVLGMLFVSFSVFVLDTIAFFILRINSPILLGALCGLTDLIPFVGPYIGGSIVLLVSLSEGKKVIIATLIFMFIIQCIENYILQPIVLSRSVKISPLLIIIGLLVFGNLFGIVGMILATPLVCVVKIFYEYIDDVIVKCRKEK